MTSASPLNIALIIDFGIVTALGLVLGSFATALIYRIPQGLSWVSGAAPEGKEGSMRSACPNCSHTLGMLDLVPVFSWAFLKGCCRYCKSKIPPLYPLTELTVLCACLGIYALYGLNLASLIMMFTMPFLIALLVIDLKYMILPNQLVAICAGFGAVNFFLKTLYAHNITPLALEYLGGAVIFAAFSWVLGKIVTKTLKKEALGFGDVKFFAVAGLWLGLSSLPAFCILSGFLGVLMALAKKIITKQKDAPFPFGPALIVSFYVLLLLPKGYFF